MPGEVYLELRPEQLLVRSTRIFHGTRMNVTNDARLMSHWGFKIHFVVGGETFSALTHARPVDENNDGSTDSVHTESEETIGDMVVESTVTYRPIRALQVKLGVAGDAGGMVGRQTERLIQ